MNSDPSEVPEPSEKPQTSEQPVPSGPEQPESSVPPESSKLREPTEQPETLVPVQPEPSEQDVSSRPAEQPESAELFLPLIKKFVEDDPVKAAHNLEIIKEDTALQVLESLTQKDLASVLTHLDPAFASRLALAAAPERIVPLFEKGGVEVCASILLILPDDDRQGFLRSLSAELRVRVEEFLTFPADSAGRSMRTDFTAFVEDHSVEHVIDKLRARVGIRRAPSNIFVVNQEGKLVGVISMRNLVVATGDELLKDLMEPEVLTVGPFDEKSKALAILAGRGFTSLPVVDSQNRLIGVVRATNLLEGAQETAAENLQKMFGVPKEERTFSSVSFSLRKRLPWLHVNLATAFLAAAVVSMFEDVIAKITILAIYLPVVAGQGGNAGAQSLAVVMRGLVMREIPFDSVRRILTKEGLIGLVNGVVIGLVTGLIAWVWNGKPYLGLVIGLAMIVNLTTAGLAGAAIPLILKRVGLDPAQSSSIVLTTVTDVVGFFAFLGFAVLFQDLIL